MTPNFCKTSFQKQVRTVKEGGGGKPEIYLNLLKGDNAMTGLRPPPLPSKKMIDMGENPTDSKVTESP